MQRPSQPSYTTSTASFLAALSTQFDVIGALVIRELHTRFGRDNIGYLWVVVEPMLLAIAVTSFHVSSGSHIEFGMATAPFWIAGYTPYIMFRSVVGRAESAIEANRSLLYHRAVTLPDVLIARALIEGAATVSAMMLLTSGCWMLGLGGWPERPLLFLSGIGLLLWFSFALSLLVAALGEVKPTAGRLVHPAVYITLPLSGAFFLLKWVPEPFRDYLTWVPLTSMFEMIREGQFAIFDSAYVFPLYAAGWSLALTFAGLVSIRSVRRGMHLE